MIHLYDKELLKRGILRVCAHYAPGEPRTSGGRTTFVCPGCSKPNLDANHHALKAGCWSPNCSVPDYVDALSLIAHFEGLDLRRDFKEILAKGYEILGLQPETETARDAKTSSPGRPSGKNPDRASEKDGDSSGGAHKSRFASAFDVRSGQPALETASKQKTEDTAVRVSNTDTRVYDAKAVEETGREHGCETDTETRDRPPGIGISTAETRSDTHPRSGGEVSTVEDAPPPPTHDGSRELLDAVYGRILALCPVEERDYEFWKGRGVSRETVRRGRFGSITRKRAVVVKERLLEEFTLEDLLSVPGLSRNRSGGLSFTLSGDYALIPYHDAAGLVTTIEGRAVGWVPEGMGKYVSLSGSGSHLYVFPGLSPERLEAFCEGSIGAIVAAQSGIAVGAIQGFRRYRSSQNSLTDGESGGPLLELRGVDFEGGRLPYIPDMDEPPKPEVIAEAPVAARWLVEEQNGEGALVALPRGMDLDEWLLTLAQGERRAAFTDLTDRAISLSAVLEEQRQREQSHGGRNAGNATAQPPASENSRAESSQRSEESARESERPADGGERERHAVAFSRESDVKTTSTESPEHPRLAHSEPGNTERPVARRKMAGERRAERARRLADAAYRELLGGCPLSEHHRSLWGCLGAGDELLEVGLFASISGRKAPGLCARLTGSFRRERLLSVAGFEENPKSGKVRFALLAGAEPSSELALVPCVDAGGFVSGMLAFPTEGRGERSAKFAGTLRVVRDGADHLWLPPGVGEPEAICESPLASVAAAARGLRVAAIIGPGRYSPAVGEDTLPELRGVEFSGGRILYIPTFEADAERRSMREALSAARRLISRHGGEAAIVPRPPTGDGFGRWVASLPPSGGAAREAFEELGRTAVPLPEAEEEVFGRQATENEIEPPVRWTREPMETTGCSHALRNTEEPDSQGGKGFPRQRSPSTPNASPEAGRQVVKAPPEMPSAAIVTAGELGLSLSGALVVFALVYVGAAFLTDFFEELASLERHAGKVSLLLALLCALWLWNARSARRSLARKMLEGEIG